MVDFVDVKIKVNNLPMNKQPSLPKSDFIKGVSIIISMSVEEQMIY